MGAGTSCVSCSINPHTFLVHKGCSSFGTFFAALGRDLQCAPDTMYPRADGDEEAHPWLTRTPCVSPCDGGARLVSRCGGSRARGRSSKGGASHNLVADFVRSLARGRLLSIANAAGG